MKNKETPSKEGKINEQRNSKKQQETTKQSKEPRIIKNRSKEGRKNKTKTEKNKNTKQKKKKKRKKKSKTWGKPSKEKKQKKKQDAKKNIKKK